MKLPSNLPDGVREVFLDDQGKVIAFTPPGHPTVGDIQGAIQRVHFVQQVRERLIQLCARAEVLTQQRGVQCLVVCIDVDDPSWASLVETLMPGQESMWERTRQQGQKPIAQGVVVSAGISDICAKLATGPAVPDDHVVVVSFAAGGWSVFECVDLALP